MATGIGIDGKSRILGISVSLSEAYIGEAFLKSLLLEVNEILTKLLAMIMVAFVKQDLPFLQTSHG